MFPGKIKTGGSGIMMYGITPPKQGTDPEKVATIARKTVERLQPLGIDALIVYDVQDESARTPEQRPFPFINALDPCVFAETQLQELKVPKIIYKPAGKFSPAELTEWLNKLAKNNFHPVFVGVPTPEFPVKTTLPEAYKLWSQCLPDTVLGAVTIPERHAKLKDEDKRILGKSGQGASYFISQCVFNIDYAMQMLTDLRNTCTLEQKNIPTLIFTLTACGCERTLKFMEWLGIHIPDQTQEQLRTAENMLEESVEICFRIATRLIHFCREQGIPFGFNIESVAIRKDEIEASISLFKRIAAVLETEGLRTVDINSLLEPGSALAS